jgi:23S rRNA pseudouridine955/2504/2580 synthase
MPGHSSLARIEAAILFEDADLLILDKPAGLAVHGGSGISYGAIEALRQLRPQGRLELVHRLDRDTSGCLVVAKRRSILRTLHEHLRAGRVAKHYQAIVHGVWPEELNRVDLALHRFVTSSGERRVRVDENGKSSLTEFAIQGHAEAATLLDAALHTGRTHQIRVHASASGFAVVGDQKYASGEALTEAARLGIKRLCLHARSFGFPLAEGQAKFESPLPADFQAAWEQLSK